MGPAFALRSGVEWGGKLSALLVVGAWLAVLLQILLGAEWLATLALGLVLGVLALERARIKPMGRGLLSGALAVSAVLVAVKGWGAFQSAAASVCYLPALIAALVPLRMAASQSQMVQSVGNYVVSQPPNRRYGLIWAGGHLFGILLNIGGLVLLLNIALGAKDAGHQDPRIDEIRKRRISTAAMRGFASNIIWSPLGLGLNLLLSIAPGLNWAKFAPYGIGGALVFGAVGWALDYAENKRPATPLAVVRHGSVLAVLGLIAILAAISLGSVAADVITGVPMRAALLLIVPVFALAWAAMTPDSVGVWGRATVTTLPSIANEISIIASASLIGVCLVPLIPERAVDFVITSSGLTGAGLGLAMAVTIFALSALGINPMITAPLCVLSALNVGAEISETLLILAVLIGWALALVVSPATSTVAITAAAVDRPVSRVGTTWNGAFGLAVLAVAAVLFWVVPI